MNPRSNPGPEGPGESPHLDEHVCLDLLQGLVSPAETEKILTHIADCRVCEKLFEERAAETERLRATRVLRSLSDGEVLLEKRGTAIRSDAGESRRERAPLRRSLSRTWRSTLRGLSRRHYGFALGGAAVAAILLVILWPHLQEISEKDHLVWLPTSMGNLQVRAAAEAAAQHDLAAGLDAYADHDAERAISLLQKAEASGQLEMLREVYLGSAYALSGRHADAVSVLRAVRLQILPDPWGSEACWTLYVALKESGQQAAADSLLQVMAEERGEVGDRARRLRHR